MKNSISYKHKNRFLLIGLLPLACFIYSFAIKRTVTLISEVRDTEQKIIAANDAPQKSGKLKSEIEQLDNRLGTLHQKKENTEQALLELVTGYCKSNGLVLREFPEAKKETREQYIIETNRIMVQGAFTSLLSLVYLLEQKNNLGKIASVDYTLKKDPRTKEQVLVSTIYLQNIKKK